MQVKIVRPVAFVQLAAGILFALAGGWFGIGDLVTGYRLSGGFGALIGVPIFLLGLLMLFSSYLILKGKNAGGRVQLVLGIFFTWVGGMSLPFRPSFHAPILLLGILQILSALAFQREKMGGSDPSGRR